MAATALQPLAAWPADLPPSPQHKTAPAPAPASTGAFAPPDAACLEWTDGCRTCRRPPAGEVACSNVGVACVQQAPRCTRR
jgi:hypothetical protein